MAEVTFASLSPSLLARKGGAKPAMRPQHAALAAMTAAEPMSAPAPDQLEDLGWNDMGEHEPAAATGAEVFQLTPMPRMGDQADSEAPLPAVVRQQEQLAERLDAPAMQSELAPAPTPSPRRRAAPQRTGRAAFTLRLDPSRHLKLRLATTIKGVSAQALVTAALDALLADMPELDTLAAQVQRR